MVDDEQINLNVLKAIFQDTYQTISAASGSQALELARADPAPDIILLDIQMPDMDGYEVCETLKDDPRTRDIPILFITVMSKETDEAKGLRLGAVDYIPKPFDPSVVHARVNTHLTLRRTLTDLARRNSILEDALNMRDSVERIVRNDLKRPLMDILNRSDRLLATRDLPASLRETVRDIERSGFELLEMIAASIDLWKLERGVYQLDPHPVNLTRIVQTVLRALSPLEAMENKAVRFITEDAPASIMIRGEELLCYSMLLHLIKNALEADPPDRPVTVALEHPPRQDTDQEGRSRIRVRIANSGVVPLEIRTRFMEKGATWGKPDGKGLGAYSARLIAETLGATLQVHIDDENQRTEIVLEFPG
nr:hybrid sensor histidine kinase/response regulator [Desulfonatronum lacustre]